MQDDPSPQGSKAQLSAKWTLMCEYNTVLAELELWRDRRAQRVREYERLQACPCMLPARVLLATQLPARARSAWFWPDCGAVAAHLCSTQAQCADTGVRPVARKQTFFISSRQRQPAGPSSARPAPPQKARTTPPGSLAQADVGALRLRLGRQTTPARGRPDISQRGLAAVLAEGERLREECHRRAAERDALIAALRRACVDLGEDAAVVAAEVHPALRSRCVKGVLALSRSCSPGAWARSLFLRARYPSRVARRSACMDLGTMRPPLRLECIWLCAACVCMLALACTCCSWASAEVLALSE